MTKMKHGLVAVVLLMSNYVIAQTVQEAKKFIYYGRTQSAKDALEKVVAGNPADAEAVYWLSQVHLSQNNIQDARTVLSKSMTGANGSNPLLLAGMGHVELSEGKANEARQRFETAISLSKGKDVAVLWVMMRFLGWWLRCTRPACCATGLDRMGGAKFRDDGLAS